MNYNKIYNPKTNKFVNIDSKTGKYVLNLYMKHLNGGANNKTRRNRGCGGVHKTLNRRNYRGGGSSDSEMQRAKSINFASDGHVQNMIDELERQRDVSIDHPRPPADVSWHDPTEPFAKVAPLPYAAHWRKRGDLGEWDRRHPLPRTNSRSLARQPSARSLALWEQGQLAKTPGELERTPHWSGAFENDQSPWEAYQDYAGLTYFFNPKSRDLVWEPPKEGVKPGLAKGNEQHDVDLCLKFPGQCVEHTAELIARRQAAVLKRKIHWSGAVENDQSPWEAYTDHEDKTYFVNPESKEVRIPPYHEVPEEGVKPGQPKGLWGAELAALLAS